MMARLVLCGVLLLGGCQSLTDALPCPPVGADPAVEPPVGADPAADPPVGAGPAAADPLAEWLQLTAELSRLTDAEARAHLEDFSEDPRPRSRLHYALLNQQLDSRDGWVVARDRLRGLAQNPNLAEGQRQLAALLERFNQSRINLAERLAAVTAERDRFRADHADLAQQVLELEQKIAALTHLENSMQQRRDRQDQYDER